MADKRLDALAGAVGEYLAKHYRLPTVPGWVTEPGRYLDHPWHVMIFNDGRDRRLPKSDAGMREYLTFASPAEFRSRNIFTEARCRSRQGPLDPARCSLFKPRMIIAIDGPAASGKGTLGKRLAAHFGLRHLDTGLIYRAVAKALLDAGRALDDKTQAVAVARALDPRSFDEKVLKGHAIGEAASIVSAIPEVRAALVAFQRDFAAAPTGAVLDGRDIGTVICPDADVKIFVVAAPEVRARRRAAELRGGGSVGRRGGDPGGHPAARRARSQPRGGAAESGR